MTSKEYKELIERAHHIATDEFVAAVEKAHRELATIALCDRVFRLLYRQGNAAGDKAAADKAAADKAAADKAAADKAASKLGKANEAKKQDFELALTTK